VTDQYLFPPIKVLTMTVRIWHTADLHLIRRFASRDERRPLAAQCAKCKPASA